MHFKIEGAYAPMFQNTTPVINYIFYLRIRLVPNKGMDNLAFASFR
jgi:hypothetical protein